MATRLPAHRPRRAAGEWSVMGRNDKKPNRATSSKHQLRDEEVITELSQRVRHEAYCVRCDAWYPDGSNAHAGH